MERRIAHLEDVIFGRKKVLHNRIKGRFGNQLFQYWIGKWIAMNTGMKQSIFFTQGFYLDSKYFPNIDLEECARVYEYVPVPRPTERQIEGPVGEIRDSVRVYNCAFFEDYTDPNVDPDAIIEEIKSDVPRKDVLLSTYNEVYKYIKRHEHWIRTLYARSSARLGPLDIIAIHVRLGDLKSDFVNYKDDYILFTRMIVGSQAMKGKRIVIVTEDSKDPISLEIEKALTDELGSPETIELKETSGDTVQEDFDILYRARTVVMTYSTFSWWAAYLNPFKTDCYVGISRSRQRNYETRKTLFEKGGPKGWHVWDLDEGGRWIRNRPDWWGGAISGLKRTREEVIEID